MPTETIFEESLRGMNHLCQLIRDGQDHSEETEKLREHLANLWWQLSQEERNYLDQLSADFCKSLT